MDEHFFRDILARRYPDLSYEDAFRIVCHHMAGYIRQNDDATRDLVHKIMDYQLAHAEQNNADVDRYVELLVQDGIVERDDNVANVLREMASERVQDLMLKELTLVPRNEHE